MTEPIISAEGLAKEYRVGNSRGFALRGVDISIPRGKTVAVVGESGSGKTTLANLILGIESQTEGKIRFRGQTLPAQRPKSLRRAIQVVPQNPYSAINPKRTVFETVSLPLAVHALVPWKKRRDRVAELLDLVWLSPDFMDRQPGVLSGGQRQ